MHRFETTLALCLLLAAKSVGIRSQEPLSGSTSERTPVLVELFTSEGCSDCPPADSLLAELDRTQFVPGAYAIVLSEHVTYWDRLGWRDPFSLDAATERQERYARQFRLESSYTPQIVVDGAAQLVGSDARALRAAIFRAAQRPKRHLTMEGIRRKEGFVEFSVRGGGGPGTKLIAVLAADSTQSEVARGENAGRTLHHTAVLRSIQEFAAGSVEGRSLKLSSKAVAQIQQRTGALRLVVFLTDVGTGEVLAVAEQKIR